MMQLAMTSLYSIGAWKNIIKVMSITGLVSNAAILTYTMDWFASNFSDVTDAGFTPTKFCF